MKKIIPKILVIAAIFCVLVSCLVVPSFAYEGVGTSPIYDVIMTPRSLELSRNAYYDSNYNLISRVNFFHGYCGFSPSVGQSSVLKDVVYNNVTYSWDSLSYIDSGYTVSELSFQSTSNDTLNVFNYCALDYGTYVLDMSYADSAGYVGDSSGGRSAIVGLLTVNQDSDTWQFRNIVEINVPMYLTDTEEIVIVPIKFVFDTFYYIADYVSDVPYVTLYANNYGSGDQDWTESTVDIYYGTELANSFDLAHSDDGVGYHVLDYVDYYLSTYHSSTYSSDLSFSWRCYANNYADDNFSYSDYSLISFSAPFVSIPQSLDHESISYPAVIEKVDINPFQWILDAGNSFFNTEIFPNITIGGIFVIALAVPALLAILRAIAGG